MHHKEFESIFTEASLYECVFKLDEIVKIRDLRRLNYTIDAFCQCCGQKTTFQHDNSVSHRTSTFSQDDIWVISGSKTDSLPIGFTFQEYCFCTRCKGTKIICNFITEKRGLIKYGQFPSIADLSGHEIKKYKKVLGSEYYEFSKAIGLVSHGIGVGSFVYLRRILENLVISAIDDSIKNGEMSESEVKKMRFSEKIESVKNRIPPFLSGNPKIYGIVSKGIHELTEEECLECFPAIKAGIELILDQKISEIERKSKEIETAKIIASMKY